MKLFVSFLVLSLLLLVGCSAIQPGSKPGPGSTRIFSKDHMTLVYVPAGEFTMGLKADDALRLCGKFGASCQLELLKDEGPTRTVYLDAFWVDQTEVTNKIYALCQSAGVCLNPIKTSSETRSNYYGDAQFDNYPVIYMTWKMAKTYCEWVGCRLPTEAEWEKAARGTDQRLYPWGNQIDQTFANYNSNIGDTASVGSYESGKSHFGAYDMAGNIWEWTSSLYRPYPYNANGGREDMSSAGQRVLRGGSWHLKDTLVRSTIRIGLGQPSDRLSDNDFGFRCAMNATA